MNKIFSGGRLRLVLEKQVQGGSIETAVISYHHYELADDSNVQNEQIYVYVYVYTGESG